MTQHKILSFFLSFALVGVVFANLAPQAQAQNLIECYGTGTCESVGLYDAEEGCPPGAYTSSQACKNDNNASGAEGPKGIRNPAIPALGSSRSAAYGGSLIGRIISNVLMFVMFIAALLVLLNFVEAGINWITAGGDTSKVQKARDKITQAVIGIVILSATIVIWQLVKEFLGIRLSVPTLFG